ncbi:glycosyltransferase family 4 protein [Vibrio hyugaensis]|uniref:glycosyltransferase family 4 protein n=1 Tax=Vibrio hyugaensis TaxID=1534743 RepID=UPI0005EE2EFE|nr:glycosyltransferase family 4 protein [Vibrio hyugaensis]
MKILFILSDITLTGGIERVISILSNSLVNHNLEIEILSLYKTNESIQFEIDKSVKITYLNKNIQLDGTPHSFRRLVKHLASFGKLRKHLSTNKYDWIIANSFPPAFQLFFSKKTSKWIVYEHVHHDYYNKYMRAIRSYIYKWFDKVVVLTHADKIRFSEYLSNVYQIYNPLGFLSKEVSNTAKKTIISVGRLEYQKGYDLLLESFSKLEQLYPDWNLEIYGEGNERYNLETQIKSLGINNAKLMGQSSSIEQRMVDSGFYVMSSRYEGFPMVLGEAMECGLPCVSFDCPNGPRDIISNKVNGFLVKNGDIDELFHAMSNMCENDASRKSMGEMAKKSTCDLKIDKITYKWLKIFEVNCE